MSSQTHPDRQAVVLAAGKGTRFRSHRAKVLHQLCGKPLISHVLANLRNAGVGKILVVVGHQAADVRRALKHEPDLEFVEQAPQLGTGHALMIAASKLEDWSGHLLVVYGDAPLIRPQTLDRLVTALQDENADQTLVTCVMDDPAGYGRISRDAEGKIEAIVEEKEATAQQRQLREVNPGFYCFRLSPLLAALDQLSNDNAQGEYYLTDLIGIFHRQGKRVVGVETEAAETRGINDRLQLAEIEVELRQKISRYWLSQGVSMIQPASVVIDSDVEIGPDTRLYSGVVIEGKSRIGAGCTIYSHCHLRNARLGDEVVVDHCSVIRDSVVEKQARVGPFAHLRGQAQVGARARIGNFVEVKKSVLGPETKAAHLSYLGDAEVGREVNIGAGTITCNYDGRKKHKTRIGDGAFVGSGSQLVAPVQVESGAYVAAGSTITSDVPADALGIARGRQVNKLKWSILRKRQQQEDDD